MHIWYMLQHVIYERTRVSTKDKNEWKYDLMMKFGKLLIKKNDLKTEI